MHTGHCLCGAVTFEVADDAINASFCHCPSCRRSAGAPMVAWAMFPRGAVRYTSAIPATYASSPGVSRGFCNRCGTTLSFEAYYMPGLIDLTVSSFADTAAFAPNMHIFTRHREPWTFNLDALASYEDLPPSGD